MKNQKFNTLEDIFFETYRVLYYGSSVSAKLSQSNLDLFKEGHEAMAKKIAEMQKNGATKDFIFSWSEQMLLEVKGFSEKREMSLPEVLELLTLKLQLDFLSSYQQFYQPIVDKIQLERDISAPTPESIKDSTTTSQKNVQKI